MCEDYDVGVVGPEQCEEGTWFRQAGEPVQDY